MPRGTRHNAYNRERQRAREEAAFNRSDPEWCKREAKRKKKSESGGNLNAKERKRIKRDNSMMRNQSWKGRWYMCGECRQTFRSTSSHTGKIICDTCRGNGLGVS